MYNRKNIRILATVLTTLFISANSITLASEITGVNDNITISSSIGTEIIRNIQNNGKENYDYPNSTHSVNNVVVNNGKIDTDADDDIETGADGSVTYIQREDINNAINAIDKRQYMRFNIQEIKHPVLMEKSGNINQILDISRGGIAVKHNNTLKVGDVIPVHITYKHLDINANVKVVSASATRAGAEFTNLDKTIANQLLYLNIMLEADNNLLATRFK